MRYHFTAEFKIFHEQCVISKPWPWKKAWVQGLVWPWATFGLIANVKSTPSHYVCYISMGPKWTNVSPPKSNFGGCSRSLQMAPIFGFNALPKKSLCGGWKKKTQLQGKTWKCRGSNAPVMRVKKIWRDLCLECAKKWNMHGSLSWRNNISVFLTNLSTLIKTAN